MSSPLLNSADGDYSIGLPTSRVSAEGPTKDWRRLATVVGGFELFILVAFLKFVKYPDSFAVSDDGKFCLFCGFFSFIFPCCSYPYAASDVSPLQCTAQSNTCST